MQLQYHLHIFDIVNAPKMRWCQLDDKWGRLKMMTETVLVWIMRGGKDIRLVNAIDN